MTRNVVHIYTREIDFIRDPRERALVEKVLSCPLFESLKDATLFKEYQFSDLENHVNGIIDLLLIYEDRSVIIDYKLKNLDDEAYRQQLAVYKRFIDRSFKRRCECYLLSVLTGEVKKVDVE